MPRKKAVFDPKDNADTPKVGGKKQTAAQKRKAEAEEKAKAANIGEADADDEHQDSEAGGASMPDLSSPTPSTGQGHEPVAGTNPGPFVTPGKTTNNPNPGTYKQDPHGNAARFTTTGTIWYPIRIPVPGTRHSTTTDLCAPTYPGTTQHLTPGTPSTTSATTTHAICVQPISRAATVHHHVPDPP